MQYRTTTTNGMTMRIAEQGIGLINGMPGVKEIIDSIISDAAAVMQRFGSIGL